jgi:hypothetical protein
MESAMGRRELRAAEAAFRLRLSTGSFSDAAKAVGAQVAEGLRAAQIGPRAHPKILEKIAEDLAEFERLG